MEKIGKLIKEYRRDFNLTKYMLIEQIERISNLYYGENSTISLSTLSRIESGKSLPNLRQLDLISSALNVDLIEIYSNSRTDNLKKIKSIIKRIPLEMERENLNLLMGFHQYLVINLPSSTSIYTYRLIHDHIYLIESYLALKNKDYRASYEKAKKILNLGQQNFLSDFNSILYRKNYKVIFMAIFIVSSIRIGYESNGFLPIIGAIRQQKDINIYLEQAHKIIKEL